MKRLLWIGCAVLLFAGCETDNLAPNEKYIPVKGVQINKSELDLVRKDNRTLFASVVPGDATVKEIMWESSDPESVAVDETGKITAIKGTDDGQPVTVTAVSKEGGFRAECQVSVRDYGIIIRDQNGNSVSELNLPLTVGQEKAYNFTGEAVLPNSVGQALVWTSDDPSVVTCTDDGVVTVVAQTAADTKITVTSAVNSEVSTTLDVNISMVMLNSMALSVTDVLLPVSIPDTVSPYQRSSVVTHWFVNGQIVDVSEDASKNKDRHPYIMVERPEIKREIEVSFDPAIPSYSDVTWELDAQAQKWNLKIEQKLGPEGEPVKSPTGNNIYILTCPKGGDMLPDGGWSGWSPENPAIATVTAKTTEPGSNVSAACKVEVYCFASAYNISADPKSENYVRKKMGDLELECLIDGEYRPVQLYYADDVGAADKQDKKYEAITLKRYEIYHFRFKTKNRYAMPYIHTQRSGSDKFFPINMFEYDPSIPIQEQNCFYNKPYGTGGSMMTLTPSVGPDEGFWIYTNNTTASTMYVKIRSVRLDKKGDHSGYYSDADVFPYYTFNSQSSQTWAMFNMNIVK